MLLSFRYWFNQKRLDFWIWLSIYANKKVTDLSIDMLAEVQRHLDGGSIRECLEKMDEASDETIH